MSKHIKIAAYLLLFTIPFFILGTVHNQKQIYVMSRGNYFFDNTRNNADIKEITLSFEEDKRISIALQDGLWRIKEADDYYASIPKINSLIKLIRSMTIYRTDNLMPQDIETHMQNSINIVSKTENGTVIDNAYIAPKNDKNKYHYAMLNNKPYLYQVTGNISLLSPKLMEWVHSPILRIEDQQIKRFKSDNFMASRRILSEELKNTETKEDASFLYAFISHFHYLTADEIKHTTNFNPQKYPLHKRYEITLFNGIIYVINVYSNDQEYWLTVRMDKEKLITKEAINILNETKLFYEGWYFKLNNATGEALFSFIF